MIVFFGRAFRNHSFDLLFASLFPLVAFLGLVVVQNMLLVQPDADSRTGFRWLLLVLAFFLPACHGFMWSVTTSFLGSQAKLKPLGWRVSLPLSFSAVRSLFVSSGWTFVSLIILIGVGMILGLFAYRDPGELFASTMQQAQEYGEGTRVAPERGAGGQSVNLEDFNVPLFQALIALSGLGALWVWLKALVCVPLRVLKRPINLRTALDSTVGWYGVRLTLWVAILGGVVLGSHQLLSLVLPLPVLLLYDALCFTVFFWIFGGMLAWHAQRYVASGN